MYEIPFSKMIQPRLGATWAYNGKDTVYASYATLQPGGQLAAARRVVGSQSSATTINAYFDAERRARSRTDPLGLVVRQAVRAGPDAARRSTSTWSARRKQFNAALVGRGSTAATASGKHFWEDTNNNARASPSTRRAGIPRELYIPNLTEQLRPDRHRRPSSAT